MRSIVTQIQSYKGCGYSKFEGIGVLLKRKGNFMGKREEKTINQMYDKCNRLYESIRGDKPPKSFMRDDLADITLEDWEAARIKYIRPTKEELRNFIVGAAEYDGSNGEFLAKELGTIADDEQREN